MSDKNLSFRLEDEFNSKGDVHQFDSEHKNTIIIDKIRIADSNLIKSGTDDVSKSSQVDPKLVERTKAALCKFSVKFISKQLSNDTTNDSSKSDGQLMMQLLLDWAKEVGKRISLTSGNELYDTKVTFIGDLKVTEMYENKFYHRLQLNGFGVQAALLPAYSSHTHTSKITEKADGSTLTVRDNLPNKYDSEFAKHFSSENGSKPVNLNEINNPFHKNLVNSMFDPKLSEMKIGRQEVVYKNVADGKTNEILGRFISRKTINEEHDYGTTKETNITRIDKIVEDEVHSELVTSELNGRFDDLRKKDVYKSGLLNLFSSSKHYTYKPGEMRISDNKLDSTVTTHVIMSKEDGAAYVSNIDLGEVEISSQGIIGKATADLYSKIKVDKERIGIKKTCEIGNSSYTTGIGTFQINETKLTESKSGDYRGHNANVSSSYHVKLEGLATSKLSSVTSVATLNKPSVKKYQPVPVRTEINELKFGEVDLKLTPKVESHHVTKQYDAIENKPIYEEVVKFERFEDPKVWQKSTRKYYQIKDNFEWSEAVESSTETVLTEKFPSEPNKFKIESLDQLVLPNDSLNTRIKIGCEEKESHGHKLESKCFSYLGFRDTKTTEVKYTKFVETSEIENNFHIENGDATEDATEYDEAPLPLHLFNQEVIVESHESVKGLFLNNTTTKTTLESKNTDKVVEMKSNSSLNQASLRGIQTLSGGATSLALHAIFEDKKVGLTDVVKVGVNTTKSFLTGHVSKIAEVQKSVKAASPILVVTSAVATIANIGLSLADKNDERSKKDKVFSGLAEGAVDLVPAALQVGLIMKNVGNANIITSAASVAIDATVSSYRAIQKARSNDPDLKITKKAAAKEVAQAAILSTVSVVASIVGAIAASSATTAALGWIAGAATATGVAGMCVAAAPVIASGIAAAVVAYGIQKFQENRKQLKTKEEENE